MNIAIKTATLVRVVGTGPASDQRLYRLDPPLRSYDSAGSVPYEYVIASASYAAHEVYLFGSDEHGEIQDWGELPGSRRGTMRHEDALENAGCEVTP